MKILLTGATGFLGFRTLEKLVELPAVEQVLATGRVLPEYRRVDHALVNYQLGNLVDPAFVDRIMQGIDVVINTASLSAPWGSRELFERSNLQTQDNLMVSARKHGASRFIYISSPSIYYNGRDRLGVRESDPLPEKFVNEYARTKYAAEQLLAGGFSPFIIFRPRALIGRGDSIIMPRLIRAYDEKKLRVIGNGTNMVDLTAVANMVDAIILSIQAKGSALNEVYNITNGEPVNLWEQIRYVLNETGRQIGGGKVSHALADLFAAILETRSRLTDQKEPALTRYGVGTLAKSFTLDISKARTLLGYEPRLSTRMAMEEFVHWYENHETH
jgi:2-alkyl-3-oxoalkanoate reductase